MKFRTLVPGRVVHTMVRKHGRRKVVAWFRFDKDGISPDLDPKKIPPIKLARLKKLFAIVEEDEVKEEIIDPPSTIDELVDKTIKSAIESINIVINEEVKESIDGVGETVEITESKEETPVVTDDTEEEVEETFIVNPMDMSYRDLQAYCKKKGVKDLRQTEEKLLEALEVLEV